VVAGENIEAGANPGPNIEIPPWVHGFAVAVAELFDCHVAIASVPTPGHKKAWGRTLRFFGYKTDVAAATWLMRYLVDQIRRHAARFRDEHPGVSRDKKSMTSFRLGMATSIIRNLQVLKQERDASLKQSTTGTALVVAKKSAVEEKFGPFKYGEGKKRDVDMSAYVTGIERGRAVNVSPNPISKQPARNDKRLRGD
jgi:hypothetical protein